MSAPEWLQTLCPTDEIGRERLGTPLTIAREDGPWTVATDGRVLAGIRGAFGYPPPNAMSPKGIAGLMTAPDVEARTLPLAELRALAIPWGGELTACEICKNVGKLECEECDGEGTHECMCHCGDIHMRDCLECDGEGDVPCDRCERGKPFATSARPAWIGDSLFDLRLFARALPYIEGDVAEFRQLSAERAAHLQIGEWLLIVMPMRPDSSRPQTDAPRIELLSPVRP